jgi:hypothetical protein
MLMLILKQSGHDHRGSLPSQTTAVHEQLELHWSQQLYNFLQEFREYLCIKH